MTTRTTFRHWAQTAHHGDEFVYYVEGQDRDEDMFEYAARLSHAALAFLYQRRVYDDQGIPAGFEHVARRTNPTALHTLESLAEVAQ